MTDADLRERIAAVVDRIQAPLTSRNDLNEDLVEFLAAKRAEAIERKLRKAREAAAVAPEALEASRVRCQECNGDPALATPAAMEEAAAVMEKYRTCECRGCKENVLGIDRACIAQQLPVRPMTSINEPWNNPWRVRPPMEVECNIANVAARTVEEAKARRSAEEAAEVRNFIPAKKFITPPKGYVFKHGDEGLGFYTDVGIMRLSLDGVLFPALPQTAPMQLRLEGLVVTKTGAPPN